MILTKLFILSLLLSGGLCQHEIHPEHFWTLVDVFLSLYGLYVVVQEVYLIDSLVELVSHLAESRVEDLSTVDYQKEQPVGLLELFLGHRYLELVVSISHVSLENETLGLRFFYCKVVCFYQFGTFDSLESRADEVMQLLFSRDSVPTRRFDVVKNLFPHIRVLRLAAPASKRKLFSCIN